MTIIDDLPKEQRQANFGKLLDYLTKLNEWEPEAFSLAEWMEGRRPKDVQAAMETWQERYAAEEPLNCGTSACIVGHMPVIFPDNFRWTCGSVGVKTASVGYTDPAGEEYINSAERTDAEWGWLARFLGGDSYRWRMLIHVSYYVEKVYDVDSNKVDVPLPVVLDKLRAYYNELYSDEEE